MSDSEKIKIVIPKKVKVYIILYYEEEIIIEI